MTYKAIANLIPTIQSASLVSHNLKSLNKKKTNTKDIVGLGLKNIVGTSLIKVNADLIGSL
jgi:hypothetical protein